MQLLSGWLVVTLCLIFGCWQPLSANPANPTAIEQAASANSATHEAVYTYRRTKKVGDASCAALAGHRGAERCRERAPGSSRANRDGSAWYQSAVS